MKSIKSLILAISLFMTPLSGCATKENATEPLAVETVVPSNMKIIALADAFGKVRGQAFPELNKYPECVEIFTAGPRPSRARFLS